MSSRPVLAVQESAAATSDEGLAGEEPDESDLAADATADAGTSGPAPSLPLAATYPSIRSAVVKARESARRPPLRRPRRRLEFDDKGGSVGNLFFCRVAAIVAWLGTRLTPGSYFPQREV